MSRQNDPRLPSGNETDSLPRDGESAHVSSPAAQRALAEAEARRKQVDAVSENVPKEIGGQSGPDPVRYGDWEKGGIASDF